LLRFENTLIFWVHAEKEILNARLDARVDDMVQQGLLDEAESMFEFLSRKEAQGIPVDLTRGVWVSIGFKELAPYFTARREGKLSEEELDSLRTKCIESIRTATRQYGGSQIKWIRNKLWRALAETDMTGRLYLLDSSDVSAWGGCITEPSEQIVQSMLRSEATPDPKSLSVLARTVLGAKEEQGLAQAGAAMTSHTCDVCGKTVVGDEQWEIHIKSYSHKRGVKSAARKAERDEYFRKKEMEEKNKEERAPEVDAGGKLDG
jgi:tRNA dimethylallyltransferase